MSKRNKVLLGAGGAVLLILLVVVSASAKREKGTRSGSRKSGGATSWRP